MTDVSRRQILSASLTAAGALVVACGARGPKTVAGAGELAPNAWIRVGADDKVTLTLDRVEMGQGTMTSHAMLVAEELEVDPASIAVDFAGAHRAFDNPDADLGFQITGGSSSVRTSFEPLRRAAATTREMLRRAGARRLGAPLEQCEADAGAIVHRASGRRMRYGELVADAAREEPIAPRLKAPGQFTWIGKDVPRKDARCKVDGTAVYGIDVKLDGLLTAVVVRAPRLGAALASFDGRAAKDRPGVVAVVEVPSGVAVVATSYWRAREASKRVIARWTGGSSVSSDRLRAECIDRARKPANAVASRGRIPSAGGNGVRTIEAIYEVPYLAHATMEPQNATARRAGSRWEVWAPTQAPGLARELVHRITGTPHEDILVHQTFVGGGFGRRLAQDYVGEAVHVCRAIGGRAVKVVWSREDDFAHDFYRPMTVNLMSAAFTDTEIVGWFHRAVSQSIVAQVGKEWVHAIAPNAAPAALKGMLARSAASIYASNLMHDPSTTEGAGDFAYDIPNLRVEHAAIDPGIPVGFWRAVGLSENGFIVESFFDEVARAMKKDPYALRRSLLKKAPKNLRVLDLAAGRAGWGSPLPGGRGRGIAQCKAFGSYAAQVAEVSVEDGKPRVHRVVCALDCGLVVNPEIVRMQIESAIAFGLGPTFRQALTFKDGAVEQSNFHDFEPLRQDEMPSVEVHIVPSTESPQGVGEPGLPPVAPAVCNAILAATGRAIRSLPIGRLS